MKHYRINDQTPLKTKRCIITPMSAKELESFEEQTVLLFNHDVLKQMRNLVAEFPDEALWHTGWCIALRNSDETVGVLWFNGLPLDKTVKLNYLFNDTDDNGYIEEALKAITNWAFARENVYFIRTEIDDTQNNGDIFEKMKFYRIETETEGELYWELERPASAWLAVYMSIGLALGLTLGENFFGTQTLGMVVGMCTGLALGAAMDSQDRSARKRENEPKKLK